MPLRHKSAIKRTKQALKRNRRNKYYKEKIKATIKKLLSIKDKKSAEEQLRLTVSLIDKVSAKGIIHKNNASRKKARLAKYVNSL